MTLKARYAGLTDIGRVRLQNEDRWFADSGASLFLVADGMGGGPGGRLAAEIVVEMLPRLLGRRLRDGKDFARSEVQDAVLAAIRDLSDRLRRESQAQMGLTGMGSTVVLMLVRGCDALIAHMGDSRAYLLRSGRLERLIKDHSIVELLIETGDITPQEAAAHPARGQLTRFVGMPGEALPEARLVELNPGDRLLLCTDGLTGLVNDERIAAILDSEKMREQACNQLITAAIEAGGQDNVTAVVVDVSVE